MEGIILKNISTPYCLKNINLNIQKGEFLVILGQSGAGKSTLLNVIAGLTNYEGEVYIGGQKVDNIPPQKRGIGYLLQDIHLFPHLTVYQNISFPLEIRKYKKAEIKEKALAIMQLLQIEKLKDRYPRNLSGGEKRRAGLARCLVIQPEILLLDEPLSSLDPVTALNIQNELKILHQKLNLTTVYVTHNLQEAGFLADKVGIISEGKLLDLGEPEQILNFSSFEKIKSSQNIHCLLAGCQSSQLVPNIALP